MRRGLKSRLIMGRFVPELKSRPILKQSEVYLETT